MCPRALPDAEKPLSLLPSCTLLGSSINLGALVGGGGGGGGPPGTNPCCGPILDMNLLGPSRDNAAPNLW